MRFIVKLSYESPADVGLEIAAVSLATHCLEVGDQVFSAGNSLIANHAVKKPANFDVIDRFLFEEKRISDRWEVEKLGIILMHTITNAEEKIYL